MNIRWRILFNLKEYLKIKVSLFDVFIILGAFLLFAFVLKHGVIPSGSMEPTLNVGDVAVVNGLAYLTKEPQRGDIVIFRTEETGKDDLIKRVIGVPGDSLMFVDGKLYINGELMIEEYVPENMETDSFRDFDEVPENCYFMMGDNRENSFDSRNWENPYVPKKNIKGKMLLCIPLSRINLYSKVYKMIEINKLKYKKMFVK